MSSLIYGSILCLTWIWPTLNDFEGKKFELFKVVKKNDSVIPRLLKLSCSVLNWCDGWDVKLISTTESIHRMWDVELLQSYFKCVWAWMDQPFAFGLHLAGIHLVWFDNKVYWDYAEFLGWSMEDEWTLCAEDSSPLKPLFVARTNKSEGKRCSIITTSLERPAIRKRLMSTISTLIRWQHWSESLVQRPTSNFKNDNIKNACLILFLKWWMTSIISKTSSMINCR